MPQPVASPNLAPQASLWQVASDPSGVQNLHGLVGDFCHLLRNRLNSLQMSLYLARRHEAAGQPSPWDELERQYRAAEGVVELFQTVCRPMPLTPISIGLGLVLDEYAGRWSPRFAAHGSSLNVAVVEEDGPTRVDPSRLAQGLDAVASCRLERAERGANLSLRGWVGGGRTRLEWSEAGSGPRGPEGELPLAALARVASAHGGRLLPGTAEGWRFAVEWPHPA